LSQGFTGRHAALLGRLEVFAGLDRMTLAKLAAHVEPVDIRGGQTLFEEGDPPDGLYVVSDGAFGVFTRRADGRGEVRLATCRTGESFGEIALLTGEVRTATVRAEVDGQLLRLSQAHFARLVQGDPSVALAISSGLIRRLRAADRRLAGGEVEDSIVPDEARVVPPPLATARSRAWPVQRTLGVVLASACVLIGWLTPSPDGLGTDGWHVLASLAALVPLMAMSGLSDGAVGLLLVAVWVLGGVSTPRVALSGFASTSWVLTVTVFALGGAIAASGLLYRLALWTVSRARAGFAGQVWALGLTGLLASPAVPNATGRMTLVAPAVGELVEVLGYASRSRPAAGLAFAALVGFGQMVAPFLTSSSTALLAFALLPPESRADLSWATWAARAMPLHVLMLAALLGFVVWRFRPVPSDQASRREQNRPEALALQRALLGPPTRQERVVGLVTLVLLLGFATQAVHKVDLVWVSVAAFVVLAALGTLTPAVLRDVNWDFILLFGVLIGIAEVVASTGLDAWLAGLVRGPLAGLASVPILFVFALSVVCTVLSLVLRWQAVVPLLIITLGPVARGAGIDPWIVAIVALVACNGFLLPYQSTVYLALRRGTAGELFTPAQAQPLAIAYSAVTILALCAMVPFWQALGLL
jgi:di/tricarboxylate transporter/CRP-like cAMP-binding protein